MQDYKYNKLLGRIKEKELTQKDLAQVVGISQQSLSSKINNKSEFNQTEIYAIMEAIDEPLDKVNLYFFAF